MVMIKKILAGIVIIFCSISSAVSSDLEGRILRLITGKWTLYQAKLMRKFRPAPVDFNYSLQFFQDGKIAITEQEKNALLSSNTGVTDRGVYRITRKYITITLESGKKIEMRILSIGREKLILRLNGNRQYKYLIFYLRKNI